MMNEEQPEIKNETLETTSPSKPRMKTWKVVALTITVMLIAGFFALVAYGMYLNSQETTMQEPERPYTPPYTPPPTPPAEPEEPDEPTPPAQTYEDEEFMDWMDTANERNQEYSTKISSYLENKYWYLLEDITEEQEDYIDDMLRPQCTAFRVSPTYKPLQTEYSEYLYDLSYGVFYTKLAARALQKSYYTTATDYLEDATDYIQKATAHLNTCNDYLNALIG